MRSYHPLKVTQLAVSVGIILGSALPAGFVMAQDTEVSRIDTITVVGEKIAKNQKDTTSAVSVITDDQFQSGETKTVNELVTAVPNVVAGGFGAISIRGIDGAGAATGGVAFYTGARARVSTVVDGVTQTWAGHNNTPNNLWDAEQVEVYRGPQSTIQGTNSIGGALVVVTKDPTYLWENAVRVGLETYENGNVKNSLAVMTSGPIIDDELAFRLAVDGTDGEGWINYADTNDELGSSPDLDDSKNVNTRAKLLWEPNAKLSAKLTLNHHINEGEYLNWVNEDDYADETLTLDSSLYNARIQDSESYSFASDVDYEFSEKISNTFHLSYLKSDIDISQYTRSMEIYNYTENVTLENRVLFSAPRANLSGVVGLFASRTDKELGVIGRFDSFGTTTVSALYADTTYAMNPDWKLVAGARLEKEKVERMFNDESSDYDENIFLPKLGVIYALTKDTSMNASVRKGYNAGSEAVNLSYDYYTYDRETVIAYETGLVSAFDHAEIKANLFYNDYTGYQAVDSFQIYNIDSSHTYGAELEGTYWASDSLILNGSLGLLQSEVDSSDVTSSGNELPSAPHTNISVGLTKYFDAAFMLGVDVNYVGEYYSDLDNTEEYKAGDYVISNARIEYVIGDFTLSGYIKNLTDEDVAYLHNFNSSMQRTAVGQPRTFGLSATYRM
ncbi:TonB-dependent receptor [Vibrio sp. HA2012]|uniref:TonB-dependent receptor n=1 Tax=Vibrio sp. HA2012 TaxID=1971595 RepID=UPI0018E1F0BD|nr:TonB-dependent receptor [Vibrio sp. HA2012]